MVIDSFCWNVRGINKKIKRSSLRKWLRQSKPYFGSIIETKVKVHNSHQIFNSIFPGWNFSANYEFAELGRIWVVWDPSVKLTIHSKSSQMITCLVELPHSTSEVAVSFIYALNCKYGRRYLWEELSFLATDPIIMGKPWAVLGGFNQTLSPSENSKGGTRIPRGMKDFRECIQHAELFDLSIRGNEFTWWNKQTDSPNSKKLDRILINDLWLLQFPQAYAHFGEPDFSDHGPSSIVFGERTKAKRQFMVSHFLFHHPEFFPRVAIAWQQIKVYGTAMYSLSKKLKLLKTEIKEINREHFSDLENRVREAHSNLISCQNQVLANPTVLLAAQEKEAQSKWLTLALAEEHFLQQRSRIRWLESGDQNSAFFHRMVVSRRAINQIHYLLDGAGNRLSDTGEIKLHCVSYFEELFGASTTALTATSQAQISSFTSFRCSDADRTLLTAPVTPADVKQEVFALPANKTPGPDGYSGEFYRKTWDIIGEDVTRAVLEFFRSGKLLKQWNCTAVSLIPKKVGADKLVDYRPISLCNVVYKVISKILAMRLQAITPHMVSNTQSAFIKGRMLVENVLLAT